MGNIKNYSSIYEIPIQKMDGSFTSLEDFRNKVLLIVNVASRCGFTAQYAQLEAMHKDYQPRGFTVLGFPCNQFLRQEPDPNKEIQAFAENRYHISFPLFAKIKVIGKEQAPLYCYLKKNLKNTLLKFVPWNFTKFLVDAQGQVVKRYLPFISVRTIRRDIECLLK